MSIDRVQKALMFFSVYHRFFQHSGARVKELPSSYILDAPDPADCIPVVILHRSVSASGRDVYKPLGLSSLTHDLVLRLTEVRVTRPATGSTREDILRSVRGHDGFAYLQGVQFGSMMQLVDGSWSPLDRFGDDSGQGAIPRAEKLGFVVDQAVVRVVNLTFGRHCVPIILRQDAGERLLHALRESCDWRAWLAVRVLGGDCELEEVDGCIIIPGADRCGRLCGACLTRGPVQGWWWVCERVLQRGICCPCQPESLYRWSGTQRRERWRCSLCWRCLSWRIAFLWGRRSRL
jgi:hypothetical protein